MINLRDERLRNVFLKPGEAYISRTPALVSTVLGSCVSVVIYSPVAGMGAICHAMLPNRMDGHELRYVDSAVSYIFNKLVSISGQSSGLEVKLFGGADMLTPAGNENESVSVGRKNIEAAFMVIEKLGLRVTASDTGGNRGRKIFFYSGSGEVLLRAVKKSIL